MHGRGGFIGSPDRRGDALLQVVPHELLADAPQRFMHGGDLNEHIGAIPILLNHFLEAANLTLDAPKPGEVALLCLRIYAVSFTRRRGSLLHGLKRRNRRLFPTTLTELSAMAALATIGLSVIPNAG